jgi:hypothetical protein
LVFFYACVESSLVLCKPSSFSFSYLRQGTCELKLHLHQEFHNLLRNLHFIMFRFHIIIRSFQIINSYFVELILYKKVLCTKKFKEINPRRNDKCSKLLYPYYEKLMKIKIYGYKL